MYYKLRDDFLLRGWQKLPYAVVDTKNGRTIFVNSETMRVLYMANGKIRFDLPLISDKQREIAKELEKEGVIILSEQPSEIADKQKYRFHDNRYMESVHWSVTGRCNYKCKHCFMHGGENKYNELKHEDIMKIVDELAECGIHKASLTGGEAMLRTDFFEIVDALIANDIIITTVYSNGHLVNDKTLSEFEKRGICPEFNMSFDGTEGWHSWLRGIEGADETIDRAFKLCKEHGFPTGAEMCLHEKNKHTLRDSINYLASVGCRSLKTNPIADVGAWHDNGYGKSIALKELFEIYLNYIPKYYEDGKPLTLMLGGFFSANPDSNDYQIPLFHQEVNLDTFCVCGHARNHLYISPEGRALPCMSLTGMDIQKNYPLILENGLRSCLSESAYLELITKKAAEVINHNDRCLECEYKTRCCGGCRASALETYPDDIMAIDEAACLIIKGGYVERIDKIVNEANQNMK